MTCRGWTVGAAYVAVWVALTAAAGSSGSIRIICMTICIHFLLMVADVIMAGMVGEFLTNH